MTGPQRIVVATLIGGIGAGLRAATPVAAPGSTPATVPLVAGLMTVSAVHEPGKGDYESIMKVSAVAAPGATFTVSANVDDRRISVRRMVTRHDAEAAHAWRPRYHEGDPESFPGATGGLGVSASVLADLKSGKPTTFTAFIEEDDDPLAALARGLGQDLGQALGTSGGDGGAKGTLQRVEPQPVAMSVLLNDVRVDLPAVHARGKLGGDDADFYILDEAALPLILQFRIADTTSRVVSITVPSETATRDLESRLAKDGRTEVYGIYFDFAKATIRPESETVLKEIADVMVKNPGWTLQVEGHTDNIGRPSANQDLSTRRSAAVRQALVDRYHVAPARLTAQGFGASRPKDTNDTLEGRARNRRVELVKR